MPVFNYTARDRTGNLSSGSLEADTNNRAAALLREQGLWVTDLREQGGGARRERQAESPTQDGAQRVEAALGKRLRRLVSLKDLALFFRQLHTLLNSGVALYQSLEMLGNSNQCPNPHLRRVTSELARHVLGGGRLSEAMARYPWLFDRMQVRMVEAGQSGGLLAEIFDRLAKYLEREYQTRMDVSRKTLYPKLVLGLLFLVLPINMPLTLAGYLRDLGAMILTAVLVCVPLWFLLRVSGTAESGKRFWDQVKLAVPVIGPLVRKMAAARFARSLASLYGAGVPIASALALSGEASGNSLLEREAALMVPAVERGGSIAQALQSSRFFAHMIVGMVQTGETTGNLDTMLDKAADFYEEESAHAVNQLVVTLGVVALLTVAVLVAIKLISFYTGMIGGIVGSGGDAGGE